MRTAEIVTGKSPVPSKGAFAFSWSGLQTWNLLFIILDAEYCGKTPLSMPMNSLAGITITLHADAHLHEMQAAKAKAQAKSLYLPQGLGVMPYCQRGTNGGLILPSTATATATATSDPDPTSDPDEMSTVGDVPMLWSGCVCDRVSV